MKKFKCNFATDKNVGNKNEPWKNITYCTKHKGVCDAKIEDDIWSCDSK